MIALTNTVTLSLVRIWGRFVLSSSCCETDLLGGHVVGGRPHVNLLIDIDTGDDEEDPGTPGSPGEEAPQPEDHCTLVLLGGGGGGREAPAPL